MRGNILRVFLIISLIVGTVAVASVGKASSSPVISVEPPTITAGVGETFTVDVAITNVSNLYFWEFHMKFDPNILKCTKVSEGPFLKAVDATSWSMMPPKIDNYAGTVKASDLLWYYPAEGATGSGILCNITFQVKKVGKTTLDFYYTMLCTFDGAKLLPIEHVAEDGFFTNVHDIAITNVTASPNSVVANESVSIDVTVANEGDFPENFDVTTYWKIGVLYDVIGINKSRSLQNGTSETLSFKWTPISTGIYTILANASVLVSITNPQGIDTNQTSNTFEDGIVTVTSLTAPVASFTVSSLTPLLDEVVTFDASASIDPDGGNIQNYEWNFGDGTPVVKENNPITNHTYTKTGEYSVILTVTDDEGEKGISQPQLIKVRGYPVAFFTYSPESPLKNQLVTFNASRSDPKGGNIDRYAWDFGDNTTGTGNVTTHTYTNAGTYKVNLTVTDSEGLSGSITRNVTVSIKRDVAVVSVSCSPLTVYIGEKIYISIKVRNNGTETETFNVTAYLDDTLIEPREVTNLAPFTNKTLSPPIQLNTTGLSARNYTITGEAILDADENLSNNKATATVTLKPVTLRPDVAITNVTVPSTRVLAGDLLNVTVTIKNEGPTSESPDIEVKLNRTVSILNATVSSSVSYLTTAPGPLEPDTEGTWTFSWDVSRLSPGVYTLSVTTKVTGEVDKDDNKFVYGNITVGASDISISANPATITLGSSTTINGTIAPVRPSVNATIHYRLSEEETWNTLETVTTNENSTYSYKWKPETVGTYEIKASWKGDNNTLPSESETLTITVSPAQPNVFLYVVAAVAVIVMAATAIYLLKIRKPKPT